MDNKEKLKIRNYENTNNNEYTWTNNMINKTQAAAAAAAARAVHLQDRREGPAPVPPSAL